MIEVITNCKVFFKYIIFLFVIVFVLNNPLLFAIKHRWWYSGTKFSDTCYRWLTMDAITDNVIRFTAGYYRDFLAGCMRCDPAPLVHSRTRKLSRLHDLIQWLINWRYYVLITNYIYQFIITNGNEREYCRCYTEYFSFVVLFFHFNRMLMCR